MTTVHERHKHLGLSIRILVCIAIVGITLYAYIEKQNELTSLRIMIPSLNKELKAIQEENIRLKYEIDRFENPVHLMELAKKPEFSHLKPAFAKDVLKIKTEKISSNEFGILQETDECPSCHVQ